MKTLPHDPEKMNDQRAEKAEATLRDYQSRHVCDDLEQALVDLLSDMMH